MEANHTFGNEFCRDLELPKSKVFPSALTMVGPRMATKPQSFYSPQPVNCIARALGKVGSPDVN